MLFDTMTQTMGEERCYEFVCPHFMSDKNAHSIQDKKRYLSTTFERGSPQSIFLLPFIEGYVIEVIITYV